MIRVYNMRTTQRFRIRNFLAGLFLGALVTGGAIYFKDGPVYTTSEIDGILAAQLTQGD